MLRRHQCGKHFDLQRRDVGEETYAVGDARFVRLQYVEHVANEIQRAGFDTVATKDYFLRIDAVGDGERRLLVAERSAGEAQDISKPDRAVQ